MRRTFIPGAVLFFLLLAAATVLRQAEAGTGSGTDWTTTGEWTSTQSSDGTEHISDTSTQTSSDGQQLHDSQTLDRNSDGSTHETQDTDWSNAKGDRMDNHATSDTDQNGNETRHTEDSYTDPDGNRTTIITDETFDRSGNRTSWKGSSKKDKVEPPTESSQEEEDADNPPKPPEAASRWVGTISFLSSRENTSRSVPSPFSHATRLYDDKKAEETVESSSRTEVTFQISGDGPAAGTVKNRRTTRTHISRPFVGHCKVPGSWTDTTKANGLDSFEKTEESSANGEFESTDVRVSLEKHFLVVSLGYVPRVEGTYQSRRTWHTSGGCPSDKSDDMNDSSSAPYFGGDFQAGELRVVAATNPDKQAGTYTRPNGDKIEWNLTRASKN